MDAETFYCHSCGNLLPIKTRGSLTTNFGRDEAGRTHCFTCCAIEDRRWMIEKGKIALYLAWEAALGGGIKPGTERITNWPGSLGFDAAAGVTKGNHYMAGVRYDVDFRGPDGYWWHGTMYGRNTQILHCRRTKRLAANTPGLRGIWEDVDRRLSWLIPEVRERILSA
jgi:hypothetical protein